MSKWIARLEYKFRRLGIDNLMLYITGTMLAIYVADNLTRNMTSVSISGLLELSMPLVFRGQIWRLITFLFVPIRNDMILWVLLSLYFYYFIGSTLENVWGRTRFTMFYFFGYIGALLAALITGYGHNMYLNLSLFLAFAAVFPDHQILLFFILPVKMKYLAYIDAALLLLSFFASGWDGKAAIIASFLNLLLFFGDNFINWLRNLKRYGRQRMNFRRSMRNNDYWR